MDGHVTLEIMMAGKFLAANRALVRLLVSVSHHVSFQRLVLREKRTAHVTIELSGIRM